MINDIGNIDKVTAAELVDYGITRLFFNKNLEFKTFQKSRKCTLILKDQLTWHKEALFNKLSNNKYLTVKLKTFKYINKCEIEIRRNKENISVWNFATYAKNKFNPIRNKIEHY